MGGLQNFDVFGVPGIMLFICGMAWSVVVVPFFGNNQVSCVVVAGLSYITGRAYVFVEESARGFSPVGLGDAISAILPIAAIAGFLLLSFVMLTQVSRISVYARHRKKKRIQVIKRPGPNPVRVSRPVYLYHGTPDIESAMDILAKNRWLVGDSSPLGVWFSDNFDYAEGLGAGNNVVLNVYVDPSVELKDRGNGIHLAHIPNAVRYTKYYTLPGIRAVGIATKNQAKAA